MAPDKPIFPESPNPPVPIAISECLAGRAVRYDGSDAWSSFPHAELDALFSFVSICPEVGIGMPVPRPPIQLVGAAGAPRVLGVRDVSLDVTEKLADFARAQSGLVATVFGYVFMERSPSCGLHSVSVYAADRGEPLTREGRGGYARILLENHPLLPVEENGRLFDAGIRESFIARVFAYAHWRRLCDAGPTLANLIEFHSRYKYLLMAHSVEHYRRAGRLLGTWRKSLSDREERSGAATVLVTESTTRLNASKGPVERSGALTRVVPTSSAQLAKRYLRCLLQGLSKPATRGGHANALSHMQGYLSDLLNDSERREITALIDDYRRGDAPLSAPRGLLLRHLERHSQPYLAKQIYLRCPLVCRNLRDGGLDTRHRDNSRTFGSEPRI